jgi:hypothetical protein
MESASAQSLPSRGSCERVHPARSQSDVTGGVDKSSLYDFQFLHGNPQGRGYRLFSWLESSVALSLVPSSDRLFYQPDLLLLKCAKNNTRHFWFRCEGRSPPAPELYLRPVEIRRYGT